MVRSKFWGKGKQPEASSSSGGDGSKKKKRKGVEIRETTVEEEEEYVEDLRDGTTFTPRARTWVSGPLFERPEEIQKDLFYEKMGDAHSIKENMCCERSVYKPDFRSLGFDEKFRNLGWEALMDFDGDEEGRIYVKSVMEWLGTLRREDGRNPPKTTKLIGKVENKEVVLSFATMRQLANFDSKPVDWYTYVNEVDYFWHPNTLESEAVMMNECMDLSNGSTYRRDNLKPICRVLLNFVSTNVVPRLGDKMAVRKPELPVLYAIMTGRIRYSFRHLVLMHVWQSRNAKGKKLIPHVRLLSALLQHHNALAEYDNPWKKLPHIFSFKDLASEKWKYKKTKK